MGTPAQSGTISAFKVAYHPYPCDQALAMRFTVDFATDLIFDVNLNNAMELKNINAVEAIYVDNLDNANRVSFVFGGTKQRISVPASSQGYYPVLASNPVEFTVTSAGVGITTFIVCNFPTPNHNWVP